MRFLSIILSAISIYMYIRNAASGCDVYTNKVSIYLTDILEWFHVSVS